jgi:hypothetical protein
MMYASTIIDGEGRNIADRSKKTGACGWERSTYGQERKEREKDRDAGTRNGRETGKVNMKHW